MASADILRAARARIEDPKNWTTEHFAKTADGNSTFSSDDDAVCWCAVGALNRESKIGEANRAYEFLALAARDMFLGREVSIVNDELGHDAVLQMYDAAIAAAEQEAGQ